MPRGYNKLRFVENHDKPRLLGRMGIQGEDNAAQVRSQQGARAVPGGPRAGQAHTSTACRACPLHCRQLALGPLAWLAAG